MALPCCRATADGIVIHLHLQPRASRNEIVGLQGEELKVRLTAPPVDGLANKLCCEYFAKLLGLPKSAVTVAAGEKSRHKRLLVRDATLEEVARMLGTAAGR